MKIKNNAEYRQWVEDTIRSKNGAVTEKAIQRITDEFIERWDRLSKNYDDSPKIVKYAAERVIMDDLIQKEQSAEEIRKKRIEALNKVFGDLNNKPEQWQAEAQILP